MARQLKVDLDAVRARASGADPAAFHDIKLAQEDRAALLALVTNLQGEAVMLQAEVDVLNGTACAEGQAEGDGPCGACKLCLRTRMLGYELERDSSMLQAQHLRETLDQFPPRDAQRWHSVRDAVHRNDHRTGGLATMADDDIEPMVVRLLDRIGREHLERLEHPMPVVRSEGRGVLDRATGPGTDGASDEQDRG